MAIINEAVGEAVSISVTAAGITTEDFVAAALQTLFTLSSDPASLAQVSLSINGIRYKQTTDYTLANGDEVTWQDAAFTLDAGDDVQILYQTAPA